MDFLHDEHDFDNLLNKEIIINIINSNVRAMWEALRGYWGGGNCLCAALNGRTLFRCFFIFADWKTILLYSYKKS